MKLPDRWRLVRVAMTLSVGAVVVLALGLSRGAANPPRADVLYWHDQKLDWLGNNADRHNVPDQLTTFTAPHPIPAGQFSINVQGTLFADGPSLAAWGIWLHVNSDTKLLIGLNGHQYVTARYCPIRLPVAVEDCSPAVEPDQGIQTVWKFFHLIAPINTVNQLELHYLPTEKPDRLTIRFAGEWMWSIMFNRPQTALTWGLWAQNPTQTRTDVQWTDVRVWGTMGQK